MQRLAIRVKTFLPKTSETIELLQRVTLPVEAMPGAEDEVQEELLRELRSRPALWVVGTSLGFEAVVLALGAWVFCRRDY